MQPLYLLLGSNCGNRLQYFEKATFLVAEKIGVIAKQSSVYETMPWGNEQQSAFLNQALLVFSEMQPADVLHRIKQIEKETGRTFSSHWGPREIDIDILLYGNHVLQSESLTIPHPYLAERKFALVPLGEIAADAVHPVLQKTISELTANCSDKLEVKKLLPVA
jgi:2-amino-4-hydroxy-6-hydroxymethyldihydropteridine diphosphokinase